MSRRTLAAILCCLLLCAADPLLSASDLHAQSESGAPISWTRHAMRSTVLGTEREYLVALPPGYEGSDARYPVLVLLDAEDEPQFVAALANIRFLADRDEIPELIVVGIVNGADRARDMTPPTSSANGRAQFPTAGGARTFAAHLTTEVLPAVHERYRTLSAVFLAGHSFGGLFVLEVATALPDAFRGAIAMSPALQWSGGEYATTYADALSTRAGPFRPATSS